METFRTNYDGSFTNSDNEPGKTGPNTFLVEVVVTGTQLATGFSVPLTVAGAQPGRRLIPLWWNCDYTFATAAWTGNTSLEMVNSGVVVGSCSAAISGGASKLTAGTIASAAAASGTALQVRVVTGDPTGGNSASSVVVRVAFMAI